jgi:hypothetical protein
VSSTPAPLASPTSTHAPSTTTAESFKSRKPSVSS